MPLKPYSWTPTYEFHVILYIMKYSSSFDFFPQPLKNVKNILEPELASKSPGGLVEMQIVGSITEFLIQ